MNPLEPRFQFADSFQTRRQWLARFGMGFGAVGLAATMGDELLAGRATAAGLNDLNPLAPKNPHFPAKAKHVIHIFAQGAPSHVDTLDPKPMLTKQDGKSITGGSGVAFGRPFLSIGIRYELTSQRLRVISGLLGRSVEEVELVRVRDTTVRQHVGERTLNVGDVTIVSNDPSNPEYTLNNITDPADVRELIRRATMAEKQRRGLSYREEM